MNPNRPPLQRRHRSVPSRTGIWPIVRRVFCIGVAALSVPASTFAADAAASSPGRPAADAPAVGAAVVGAGAARRPRIGLVLGGGGARGAAHIGVLEELQRLRVPVDCVAGTSMGSLVAGAFAAGLTPAQMRAELAKADWDDMFVDNPDYADYSFRNKELTRRFIPGLGLGVGDDGISYASGVVAGQKIKLFFNRLVHADLGEREIGQLPLPLSIVATDIGSGERVVLRDGSLTLAMRASMSVPGLMSPVTIGARKLVDGGLVDNVPIAEVRERCGAEITIAVNVGSPLLKPEQVGSLLSVSAQMVNILTQQNVDRSLATLKPDDIYILPALEGITSADFARHATTADRGRDAVAPHLERLQALSVGEAEYARWWQRIATDDTAPRRVDAIEIADLKVINPRMIERQLSQQVGAPLDTEALNRDLVRVYGDGFYNYVDYSLVSVRDRNVLRILPMESTAGLSYIRSGINLETDSKSGSTYSLRLGYQKTWLNSLGGEILIAASFGTVESLGVELYQPLTEHQDYYLEAAALTQRRLAPVFQNDHLIAQYHIVNERLDLALGANIGHLGRASLGWRQMNARAGLSIGDPVLPGAHVDQGGVFAAVNFDQFDRLYFPTRGWATRFELYDSAHGGYTKLSADVAGAVPYGDYVLAAHASYVGSVRGALPILDATTLGGFLNLSAFGNGQLVGDDVSFLQVRAENIIGRLPIVRSDMRLGLALEAGHLGTRYTETSRSGWLQSVTVYIGGETPIGPVFLGYGQAAHGISNAYLFFGKP